MKNRKVLGLGLAVLMAALSIAGCSKDDVAQSQKSNEEIDGDSKQNVVEEDKNSSGEKIIVSFWSGTEQFYYDFWSKYAEAFNKENMEVDGKIVEVQVQMMSAQPSSEAGIQNAIATGTAPALSENITRSFGATLAEADVVYDISEEEWYRNIVAERDLESIAEGWEIDGKQYIIPVYANPITLQWNAGALRELGATKVPETLEDLNALLVTFKENRTAMADKGVSHFMYAYNLTRTDSWWERWFDFESPYKGLSGGGSLVEGNSLTMDLDAAQKVLEMYGSMGDALLTGEIPQVWQQENVPVVMGIGLPWEIQTNAAAGKTYGFDGDYVFGPNLVKQEGDKSACYADSKGIVLYKTPNITQEQHEGAVEFMKWVYTGGGKDTVDIDWITITSMLPVRGDIETNPTLTEYFEQNPGMKDLSKYVAQAIPCMQHAKMVDMLTAIGEKGILPYITESTKCEIGNAPDATPFMQAMTEAVKAAGGLDS